MYHDVEFQEERKYKWLWWAVPIVVIAGLGGALYYGRQHKQQEAVVEQVKTPPAAPAADTPQHHPIAPSADTATPLPALGASDPDIQQSLDGVFGRSLENFLVPKNIVRHVVATIDNLPRKKTAVQMWPLKPTAGEFVVDPGDDLLLSEQNFARYEPIMTVLKNTDAEALAKLYKRYYPLFQQAYVELGYPNGYFNDRLIAVIDHLLETPDVQGSVRLVQPSVHYEFADRALEERSAGQKLLIRMGSNNAALIKLKLRELRREVANRLEEARISPPTPRLQRYKCLQDKVSRDRELIYVQIAHSCLTRSAQGRFAQWRG